MNNDLISRQAVIDHINKKREEHLESADLISRQAAILALAEQIMESALMDNPTTASTDIDRYRPIAELSLRDVPSAQPYTEEEIQAMQDLEQAQLDKAYQIGVEEGLQSAQPEQIARDIATIIENERDMRVLLKNTERTEKHDLVSRRAAIETAKNVAYAVDEHGSADGWLAMLVNWLEILPSAQPEHTETHSCDCERTETHGWIPVTEALPEDGEYMFTWIMSEFPNKRFVGIAKYEEGEWLFDDYLKYIDVTVTAWMPLPEPYKEGQND